MCCFDIFNFRVNDNQSALMLIYPTNAMLKIDLVE